MSDTGFASLSPTLLARKGGARPAMRPQNGAPGKVDGVEAAANLEDLGWNDMGDQPDGQGEVVSFKPDRETDALTSMAPSNDHRAEATEASRPHSPVQDTLERIQRKLETPNEEKPARAAPPETQPAAKPTSRPAASGKRAAFTLRLDHERHLKLRLACTVKGRSAQQLVTDALDSLLREMPEIEQLAAQVPRD